MNTEDVNTMKRTGIRFTTNGHTYRAELDGKIIARVVGYDKTFHDLYEAAWTAAA